MSHERGVPGGRLSLCLSPLRTREAPVDRLTWTFLLSFLMLLSVAGEASAETQRPFKLRLGVFSVQPTSHVGFGYDNNIFYDATEEPDGRVPNDGWLLIGGGRIRAKNERSQRVLLELDSNIAFRHYTGADLTGPQDREIREEIIDSRTGVSQAAFNGRARFNPAGTFQASLYNQFTYLERPSYEFSVFGFERIQNIAGGRVHFMPGGRGIQGPLELNLGYGFEVIDFLNEPPSQPILGRSKKNAHRFSTDLKLRFLPKNYFLFKASYVLNDYNDFQPGEDEEEGDKALSRDSRPLRVTGGLTGLITPRVSVVLNGGYAHTFNDNGPSFKGFIGLLELNYVSLPRFRLGVGYQRDGRDSGFSNFYVLDRGFFRFSWNLSGSVLWSSMLSYDLYRYERTGAIQDQGREDPVLRIKTDLSFRIISSLALKFTWSLEENFTEYALPLGEEVLTDFAAYQRQLYLVQLVLNP